VLREQEGVRGYAELQSKHRAAYGDDEEAREAAGRAALLRANRRSQPAGRYALAKKTQKNTKKNPIPPNMRIHVRIQLQSKYVEYVLPKHVGAWRGDVFWLENGRDTTNVQGLQPTGSRSKSVFGVKSKKE